MRKNTYLNSRGSFPHDSSTVWVLNESRGKEPRLFKYVFFRINSVFLKECLPANLINTHQIIYLQCPLCLDNTKDAYMVCMAETLDSNIRIALRAF